MENKTANTALKDDLLTRQDYLVVQGNDLAKSFGNLKAFEQKVLDYCFSFVKKEDRADKIYSVSKVEILCHFGLSSSGDSYERLKKAFKKLATNTALYLPTTLKGGEHAIMVAQVFSRMVFGEFGTIQFKFSEEAAPYVFELSGNFYSFHLSELAQMKGKYGLILLKLWESNRNGNNFSTTITGSMEDWQNWFLGDQKRVSAGRFYTNILKRAGEEVESKFNAEVKVTSIRYGRKIVGYRIEINDRRKAVSKPLV